ncbi:hypothetical protein B566_EDAN015438 [Ephemera danica]|nr:hypothetical protein B566_EDAN015438 [Ephemera danica]
MTPSFILLVTLVQFGLVAANSDPRVILQQGTLKGKFLKSYVGGKTIFAFQSIPYAAPPVGVLRFQPPQDAPTWSGERLAQSSAPTCPQVSFFTGNFEGQEDCFVDQKGLNVMFWLHGGGFFAGSGNPDMFGPEFLLDHDVILVTVNYRLGPLGFLSLNSRGVTGNYGLKDQVAALRWVRDNIANFGGNPNSVTVFGESAGAASVHFLMMSPLAKGLFHRAIVQSGSAFNDWAFERQPERLAADLVARMGCDCRNESLMMACLRASNAQTLAERSTAIMTENNLPRVFAPIMEPVGTEGAFLSADPSSPVSLGQIRMNDVPLMAGVMTHEAIYHLIGLGDKNPEEELQKNREHYVPEILGINVNSSKFEEIWREIRDFYDKLYPDDPLEKFVILNSDVEIVFGVDELVRVLASSSSQQVFYYQFSYDGGRSTIKSRANISYNGTCHEDELAYLFTGSAYPSLLKASSQDFLMIARLSKMWTDFAKTGNPTPSTNSGFGTQWKPVDKLKTRYLDIGVQLVMRDENMNEARVYFWRELVRKHRQN